MMKHRVRLLGFVALLNLLALETVSAQSSAASQQVAPHLQENLINAQIRQLNAQSAYYERQSNIGHTVLSALSGALGALLGALLAFFSLRAQARFQARREDERSEQMKVEELEKWERDRVAALEKEAWAVAAELAKRIAMAAASMTWMLWSARHDKARFMPKSVDEHDQYMKSLYAEIVAAQVSLAAVNRQLYEDSLPLVYKLYNIDAEIALCAIRLPESIDALGNLWERARRFEDEVPVVFSRIVNRNDKSVAGSAVVAVQSARARQAPSPGRTSDGAA